MRGGRAGEAPDHIARTCGGPERDSTNQRCFSLLTHEHKNQYKSNFSETNIGVNEERETQDRNSAAASSCMWYLAYVSCHTDGTARNPCMIGDRSQLGSELGDAAEVGLSAI
jgi:hypothetical protein